MEKQLVLKLLYAGLSTQELHKIYAQFGTFKYAVKKYEALFNDDNIKFKIDRLKTISLERIEEELRRKNVTAVGFQDSSYPQLLKEITDFPFILFCRGNVQLLQSTQLLAVVGGRARTTYTPDVLKQFIPRLHNVTIVSGLAKGTDSDAHVITMLNNGLTIGVLGFGHDHHYPEETRLLRSQMERHQLVISEYPPAAPPKPWQFPERNRLISGLCQGTLVTEAKERSGSLITVDQALDQNRNVYCLPGPITSIYSAGCNARISEGAKLVLTVDDILVDYQ